MVKSPNEKKIEALRTAWEEAVSRDRPRDALSAILELEGLEPSEPRWSHRAGDTHRRLGEMKEAEAAYERAVEAYARGGYLPRAVAMAKALLALNPARRDVLAKVDPTVARSLPPAPALAPKERLRVDPAPPVLPTPAALLPLPPIAPPPKVAAPPEAHAPRRAVLPSPASPVPTAAPVPRALPSIAPPSMRVRDAAPLERAGDAVAAEIRFADAPGGLLPLLDLTEADLWAPVPQASVVPLNDEDLEILDEDDAAARLVGTAACRLFAELSPAALEEVSLAADLVACKRGEVVVTKGDPADALYVIVEGGVEVELASGEILALGEGDVFGETCLLDENLRSATVRAAPRLVALRLAKRWLDTFMTKHADLEDALYKLLVRRLLANVVQESPLFASFDVATRLELSRMFEVRRAGVGTLIAASGKRADGLYLVLTGRVTREGAALPRGATFGQDSLLSSAPATATVRAETEAILLRLPASKFGTFAALYPPALSQL